MARVDRSASTPDPLVRLCDRAYGHLCRRTDRGLPDRVHSTWLVQAILVLAALAFPALAIGAAILRYRLYDIDRVVSRTIAYAVVTAGLLIVYLAVNLGLTTILSSVAGSGSVAVAASTLVVAALFTPVRRRVQRIVDRRFDRARYDAERTTAAFSERLRNEVDLAAVAVDLDQTVRAAIAPTSVNVWLRAGNERIS